MTSNERLTPKKLAEFRELVQWGSHLGVGGSALALLLDEIEACWSERKPVETTGWRPLSEESEVTDGAIAIGAVPRDGGTWAVGEMHYTSDGWYWAGNDPTDSYSGRIYPTRWMPLPAPPCSSVEPADRICSCGKRMGEHPVQTPWWPCQVWPGPAPEKATSPQTPEQIRAFALAHDDPDLFNSTVIPVPACANPVMINSERYRGCVLPSGHGGDCSPRQASTVIWKPEVYSSVLEKATASLPACECLVRDKSPSAYHNIKCPRYVADLL